MTDNQQQASQQEDEYPPINVEGFNWIWKISVLVVLCLILWRVWLLTRAL